LSEVTVLEVKQFLRIIHAGDDLLLQTLIDAAEDEARRYLNRDQLATLPLDYPPIYDSSSSEIPEPVPGPGDPIAPSVRIAIYYLVQCKYENTKPDDIPKMRAAAETLLQPYRTLLGT